MAVSVNASGSRQTGASVTTLAYTGLTLAAGSDSAIVIAMKFSAVVSSVTAVWDSVGVNQSFSQIATRKVDTWNDTVYIFGLVAPGATGNKTISLNWTTAASIGACAMAFDGVLQTSAAAAFTNVATAFANGANPTLGAITTASGDATFSAVCDYAQPSARTQTLLAAGTNAGTYEDYQYALSTGTSDTHSWTAAGTQWGAAGMRINQVAAASGSITPTVGGATLTGVAARMDLGISPRTTIKI